MSVTVRVPGPLRRLTGGQGKLEAEPGPVGSVLATLAATHEGLRARLFEADAQLRSVVRVFVGEADIRTLEGLETPVADGDVLSIVMPVAGA